MEETKLFLITYFAAFLGVLPPGLVNMSVAKTCVKHSKESGVFLAIGASFVVLFQALIAILLAKYIFNNPFVHNILLRTGLVIFLLMGIYFFIMAKRKRDKEVEVAETNDFKSLLKGMMIAMLNVFPIPFFCALGAGLNVGGNVEYRMVQILVFIFAASLGTFTSLYIYASFFDKIEEKADYFTKYSNYFMAALMLILVVITLVRIYYP